MIRSMKLIPFFALLFLVACGQGSQESSVKKTKLTVEQMDMLMAQQSISCPSGDCPDAIARLFIVNFDDADKSSLCSGALVGPRHLLTNSHCLETGKLAQACEGFYAVFKRRFGYEVARCKEILFRHDFRTRRGKLSNEDYALVELDREVRARPLQMVSPGMRPGDRVTPYVVDHISAKEARIVRLDCQVSAQSRNGQDLFLERCPVISGNSGSPILDIAGDVVGLVYAAEPTSVDERTPFPERTQAPTLGLGFPTVSFYEAFNALMSAP